MIKHLANFITITRLIGTLALLPFVVEDKIFMIIYVYCGLSDVLDGFIARKLNIISDIGSKLDTASDLIFYSVMMFKIWHYLKMYLPNHVWVLIYVILLARLLSYLYVYLSRKTLSSPHTIINKVTGLLMFLLPFVVKSDYLVYYSYLILLLAYISEIDEISRIIKG